MNDDAIFLKYRVNCIAGKPPPTKGVHSADYVLFDQRRFAGVEPPTILCHLMARGVSATGALTEYPAKAFKISTCPLSRTTLGLA